jgi:hypothetical protein
MFQRYTTIRTFSERRISMIDHVGFPLRDNGPTGIRAHDHQDCYGAFVIDPDGNTIEAVCHRPLTSSPA